MEDLDYLLSQIRRIEENRESGVERQIQETYQKLLKDLRSYMAEEYSRYAEDDKLTYEILQKNGAYARFLEEVEQKINSISPETKRLIRSTVEQTYEVTYNGMLDCVGKVYAGIDVGDVRACTPDVIKRAVENPISKLTLNDRLEKHRKEIVYDIKQDISVGLLNGDRYSTMARRIKQSVEGDYKKAIRIARTETHRVREAGNHDAARSVNDVLKESGNGMQMMKTWKTMKDERVRTTGKGKRYDHRKMDGVSVPMDEEFTLPSGAKTTAPGQSGVAGEDIHCRCYLSYGLQKAEPNLLDSHAMKLPDEIMEINGMTEDTRIEIEKSITLMEKKYDLRLEQVSVEPFSSKNGDAIMLAGPYKGDDGTLKMALVINKDIDYTDINKRMARRYAEGKTAAKNVSDIVTHEMAHVLTFQGCETVSEYNNLRKVVKGLYIEGISGYSDHMMDGAETLAEAFVRMSNGEKVPAKAKIAVMKYISRWKK